MHKPRRRIALLVGGSVLMTLFIFMLAFNLIMQQRMKENADTSLRSSMISGEQKSAAASYTPEMIAVFDDDENSSQLYTQKELSIIDWSADKANNETALAEIDGNTYYIMSMDLSSDTTAGGSIGFEVNGDDSTVIFSVRRYGDGNTVSEAISVSGLDNLVTSGIYTPPQKVVGYVDITGELELIRQINIVFLIAALVIGLAGSTLGYLVGRRLEQSQLAQKQFFENTSHELKTPLTSIRGYAEGIETGVITDLPKTGRVIAAQTEKMSRLIEEILCMAKLESGSVKLQREDTELSAFLQDCLMPFEGTVLTRGLQVELNLHPVTVSADSDKLDHAVSNLLTNAFKYAKTKIVISCQENAVRISNDCDPVSDEDLRHLFDRFYTGRDGNTGIGLSIARDIIMLHGWKLTAARTADGIEFCISI